MKLQEFKNSKWYREALNPGAEKAVGRTLPGWIARVNNIGLVAKANELWSYLTGGKATGADKVLVIAALAYLISPIDLIPDAIPVLGWLDDVALASFVLQYLSRKIAGQADDQTAVDNPIVIDTDNWPKGEWQQCKPQTSETPLSQRIDVIRTHAVKLQSEELADAATALEFESESPVTQVLFAGRYNSGKSTLLNALLGYPWLPVGPVPTTHAISYILGGPNPSLVTQNATGVATVHSGPQSLMDKSNPDLMMAKSLVLTLPSPLLKGGITLVDSPGLEDPDLEFTRLTLDIVPAAAMVVLVLDATALLSAPEAEFIEGLLTEDRDRKLFVVINKADRLSSSDRALIVSKATEQLRQRNCTAPLFILSAKDAGDAVFGGKEPLPHEFLRFQEQLSRFIQTCLSEERRRYLASRVDALEQGLRATCATCMEKAEMEEQSRNQAVANARKANDLAKQHADRGLERMQTTLDRLERRTLANFQVFFGELDAALSNRIDGMGLDELRDSETLAGFVRQETKKFADAELQAVHSELGGDASTAIYDLQVSLHGLPFRMSLPSSASTIKPELIPPAVLVLTFPFMGMFSWIYLATGVMFGRNAIEKLSGGLIDSVGLSKFRSALFLQLVPKLKEFEQGVTKELENHFNALRKTMSDRVERLTSETLSPVNEMLSSPPNAERLKICREILGSL